MKRIILSLVSVLLIVGLLAACGESKTNAMKGIKLSDYVEVGNIKKVKIDKQSEEFKAYFDEIVSADAAAKQQTEELHEGTVQMGDTANINFEGKLNGVAFEGGTSENYDLTIGSGQFIDGFEDGLVGVAVGQTVDLNLTFPKEYQSAELAGQAVVFTVKVNYIKRVKGYEQIFSALGFESAEKYKESVEEKVVKMMTFEKLSDLSKFEGTPSSDTLNALVMFTYYDRNSSSMLGMSFEKYLSKNDLTMEKFAKNINEKLTIEQIVAEPVLENVLHELLLSYKIVEDNQLKIDNSQMKGKSGIEQAFYESKATVEAAYEYIQKQTK